MFCYIPGSSGRYRSQESARRSRFVLAFIDSLSPSPSRTNSFVFVLLYYLEIRNGIAQEICIAEQICIGCYRSLVAQPEQTKQFCICFCILLWIPGSIVKKNLPCPVASPNFQKTHVLAHFWVFFVDIHHRLRPRRGLGRLGLLEGKKRSGFLHPLFSRFFANLDSLRITGLTIGCTARAKQTALFVFVYYCESKQASLRKIGPAGPPAGQVNFFKFKLFIFNFLKNLSDFWRFFGFSEILTLLCESEYLVCKKCRFVFVLLYSRDFRNVWFTKIDFAEQISIGFYRFLGLPLE